MPDSLAQFRKLLDYDKWANARTLDALRNAKAAPPKAVAAFAHVLAARRRWLGRVQEDASVSMSFTPQLDLAGCEALMRETDALWDAWLAALKPGDLDRAVNYVNTHGKAFRARIADMLTHLALHSAHHCGQVAMLLRMNGDTPQDADYYISPMAEG